MKTAIVSSVRSQPSWFAVTPFDEASRLQAPWANDFSEDLAIKDIDTTRRVVKELRKKLELNGERAST